MDHTGCCLCITGTGSRGKQLELTFQDKLKIAIGIAEGIRYMHEECPRGPVVHGELVPSNIFLRYDLRPLVKISKPKVNWGFQVYKLIMCLSFLFAVKFTRSPVLDKLNGFI